jgi:two-component sensor histidine kinase/putative methionine-R-sulfoxide reductase with GAF domain
MVNMSEPNLQGPAGQDPVVERPRDGTQPPKASPAVNLRLRQQEILAELGVISLKRTSFEELLGRTVQLVAEGLETQFCKILEYLPESERFLLRAGVGWEAGLIGVATISAGRGSPAGYALQTGKPVISNHLENEERFTTPQLLREHGVRRAINVIIQGDEAPFGVLEVDSRSEGEFTEQDIAFLQGTANVLAMAIERQRYERRLQGALEAQKLFIKEINHRVKNSLQLVASMFSLQANASEDLKLAQALNEATGRVTAIARIHERLYRDVEIFTVDLAAYVDDVCTDLASLIGNCELNYDRGEPVRISTDRAVRIALIATELVTNASKHAYQGGQGAITVTLTSHAPDCVILSVRDAGSGMPPKATLQESRGLGSKLIRALVTQLGATYTIHALNPGTEVMVEIPLAAADV